MGFFGRGHPNKKKNKHKNKMSSDMGSVPDPKFVERWLGLTVSAVKGFLKSSVNVTPQPDEIGYMLLSCNLRLCF